MQMMDATSYRGTALLCDFTDARPGEMAAAPLLYNERKSISLLVDQHGGQTLEGSIRNYFALFPQADNALTVARQVIRDVVQWRNTDSNRRGLTCRLILGYGTGTLDNGRLRSDWTHKLSGLISQVPEYSIGALPEFVAHAQITPAPKLFQNASGHALYQIDTKATEESDRAQTRHAPSLQIADASVFTEINLTIGGKLRVIKASECPLLIGRENSCGLILSGDMVSRVHGTLLYENGKFFYADDSRNGSFVLTASGEEVFLRGERLPLIGQGAISPGAPLATQRGQVLRFACTSSRLAMANETGDTHKIGKP
jgi:hypothetical protein